MIFRKFGLVVLVTFLFVSKSYSEGSKNITPSYGTGDGTTNNDFIGYLCHDQEGGITSNFLNSSASADERLYVYIKDGETVYMGFRRILPVTNFQAGAGTFGDATLNLRENDGTLATTATLSADAGSTQSASFTSPQTGVIDSYAEALAGPAAIVGGSGYAAISYTNNTGTDQDFYIELSEAAGEESWYDLWDISVYDGTEEKAGRLHSKNWGFSAGSFTDQFSDSFILYVQVPSTVGGSNAGNYIKSLDLGGLQPYTALIYANSTGADIGSTSDLNGDGNTDFQDARRTQSGNIGATEYDIFINNPDIELYPTTELPSVTIADAVFSCNSSGDGGQGTIYFETNQTGIVAVLIDLNGESGYQDGTEDVIVEQTVDASSGSARAVVLWDGLDGNGTAVPSGTEITISGRFTSGALHVPIYDPEINSQGIDMRDVRPATSFDLIYWDDRSQTGVGSSPTSELTGSNSDQHTWNDGNGLLVNTWSFGYYQVNSQNVTFTYYCDTDEDSVTGVSDDDTDNDGLTDAQEGDWNDDTDADGIFDYVDVDFVGYTDTNGDGINDNFDLDLDGIPNALDLDSDNDGVSDIIESGQTDSDNDGKVDGFTDVLGGTAQYFESTDCSTTLESTTGHTTGPTADDGNVNPSLPFNFDFFGTTFISGTTTTFNSNGWFSLDNINPGTSYNAVSIPNGTYTNTIFFNHRDHTPNTGGSTSYGTNGSGADEIFVLTFTDVPFYNGSGSSTTQVQLHETTNEIRIITTNFDPGTAENTTMGLNVDGTTAVAVTGRNQASYTITTAECRSFTWSAANGVDDTIDSTPITATDNDSDGQDDYLDLDSDNDGIVDTYEFGLDSDNDGQISGFTDADANGRNDTQDIVTVSIPDNDADGIDNYHDIDSDNDGILDNVEGQASASYITSSATDANTNGVYDVYEPAQGGTLIVPVDTDSDASEDYIDSDSDGDGVSDLIEGWDTDFDGYGDWDATGSNNDITDETGYNTDTDTDGLWDVFESSTAPTQNTDGADNNDWQDTDDDNDGELTAGEDANGNNNWTDDFDDGGVTIPDYLFRGDYDGDGIADASDYDSDNDGILDSTEDNGESIDPSGDSDADGVPNYRDSNVAGSLSSSADTNSDGVYDVFDTDLDGIPDFLDLDSDDDGVLDAIEARGGTIPTGLDQSTGQFTLSDPDNDGLMNYFDSQPNQVGGVSSLTNPDTDGDGIMDYLDVDSDGDGVLDLVEIQTTDAYTDLSGNDGDGDGIDDTFDPNDGGSLITPVNTDGSDLQDYRDTDSDNDNVTDLIEANDADNDGVEDASVTSTDTDGDGLDDAFDTDNGGTTVSLQNTDASDEKDWRDTDDDNDGTLTIDEDANSNGDYSDDQTGGQSGSIPDYLFFGDTDGDGILDASDQDSDNDGIPDSDEDNGEAVDPSADADGDGIPNYRDPDISGSLSASTDSNGDGVYDVFDRDLDGVPDFRDVDSDNDGVPDLVELGGTDSDGDGRVDNTTDTDGDGYVDLYDVDNGGTALTIVDTDGDGIHDHYDLDSDDDGIPDLTESGGTDTDGDGKLDDLTDSDYDGFADLVDSDNGGTALTNPDTDADGVLDKLDADSDNDGIPDPIDNGGTDTNYDGKVDDAGTDSDNDGLADSVDPDAGGTPINDSDIDGDGLADYQDLDSDNDGYPDLVEGGGTDSDNDGVVDTMADIDGDGIPDAVDVDQTAGADVDVDGIDDAYDVTYTIGNDTDGDGIDNNNDPDKDGDGLDDASESVPLKQVDTDGDLNKDFRDLDSDNDGLVDAFELGLSVNSSTGTLSGFTDTDSDGFNDTQDGIISGVVNGSVTPITPPNTDTASEPASAVVEDFRDLDTDNDGIVDNIESQTQSTYIALSDSDTDGDGLDDAYDPDNGGSLITPVDTDANTSEDIYDSDSDGDGITDLVEGDNGDKNQYGDWDANANGTFDDSGFDTDTDSDGILDIFDTETEAGINGVTGAQASLQDSDHDGTWDFQDTDDDGDGTLTSAEGTTPTQDPAGIIPDYLYDNSDSDGDGVVDGSDADFDNDGLANSAEDGGTGIDPSGDIDSDGLLNFEDSDMDGDGIANTADTNGDGSGTNTTSFTDSDGDGVIDIFDKDLDGVADYRDRDSDNDGITDVIELGLTDNGDGTIGAITDANANGLDDNYDPACALTLVAGNGQSQTNISVNSPDNALGAVDASRATLNATGDYLIIDLGTTILSGESVFVNSRINAGANHSAHQIGVGQSTTGVDGDETNAQNFTYPTQGVDQDDEYVLTADARYIHITLAVDGGNRNIQVDAVYYSYSTNPCGTTTGTAVTTTDTDSDGVDDHLDLDSDQDGISDLIEAQAATGFISPDLTDTDEDGIMDVYDANDDDAGDGQSVSGTAITPINTDGADNDDYLDTDSDNDGISDYVEAWDADLDGYADWDTDSDNDPTDESGYSSDNDSDGISYLFDTVTGNGSLSSLTGTGATLGDTDGDDVSDADLTTGLDYRDNDDDGDGTATASEDNNSDSNWAIDFTQGGTPVPDYLFYPDNDGDGILDNVDGDSDNDGILSASEYNGTAPFGDDDVDGIYNYLDSDYTGFTDSNGDGVDDRVDQDRDGVPNFFDLDSDNDGLLDAVEANDGVIPVIGSFDVNTGVFSGTDGDTDGIIDAVEAAPLAVSDFDSDGLEDYFDLDSDNDGVTDQFEAQTTANYHASTGTDTDGDGLDDSFDVDNSGTTISTIADTDTDGEPDHRDQDSDDDLVEDFIEAFDANKNGYSDLDTNLDGDLSDETGYGSDTDSDGLRNLFDSYSGYGLSNILGSKVKLQDTDADGTYDFRDTDDDTDNINTISEDDNSNGLYYDDKTQGGGATPDYLYFNDIDGDGIADGIDRDSDNDGITDLEEPGSIVYDGSDNITNDGPFDDDDGDGIFNYKDSDATNFVDSNTDGIDDRVDYDLDGFADFFDLDSDNDGIPDAVEGNAGVLPTGANDQGQFPGGIADADSDGLADIADGGNVTLYTLPDTDGDGVEDRYDIDSDNDGITDVVEAGGSDGDGDGILDSFGDIDGDGLGIQADSDDGGAAFALTDTNTNGVPNYREYNSDGDGFPDWDEGMDDDEDNDYVDDYATRVALGAPIADTNDTNTNSVPDYLDDTDGDGLANFLDPDNATYYQDTDGDGLVDFFDPDQGGVRYARLGEPDSDSDGTPNYRDASDTPLPLDWLTFEVTQVNGAASVVWSTTNEENVSHFEVERSLDGRSFDVVGEVVANNVANEVNHYEYLDVLPAQDIIYYRTKQVDVDGLFSYSSIRMLIIVETTFGVSTYPNPVISKLMIEMDKAVEGRYDVIALDGKRAASGYISADRLTHEIDLNQLPHGIYQVMIQVGKQRELFKIIKQ